jgi:hypothetical protein
MIVTPHYLDAATGSEVTASRRALSRGPLAFGLCEWLQFSLEQFTGRSQWA